MKQPTSIPAGAARMALLLGLLALPAAAETVAYVGATVHPVSGPPIDGGVMVVEDGVIRAVGAGLAVPEGAEVVELNGLHLYPGFVHPLSALGLIEIGSVRGTRDLGEVGDNNAALRAEVAWNADSLLLPVAAAGGVLTAHVAPQGGTFAGSSAVMRLDGWNWHDMTLAAPAGMHLAYPQLLSGGDDEDFEEKTKRALETINATFDDARAYRKAKDAGTPVDRDADLEALLPVLDGSLPLYVHAEEKSQIESALDWAAEQGFDNLVLVTTSDARYVAERLAKENVPVVLNGVLRLPRRRWEPYDAAYVAARVLHEAGVRFAIGDGDGGFAAANARNLPFHAAMAAAFGLPEDVALRSVTLTAAEILGVADRVGSLDPGKEATFFAATGDPLEITTRIERTWIRGRELDPEDNHQWRLYQRYNARPRAEEPPP
ncbi:MAG: imidazolonepropionase [Acidobacteria bacterium]|nr:MAG: imidazolonepropionase [Acidobacteriota bacterium]